MAGTQITLKQAGISIKKFNEIGIPHHLGLLKNHKSNIVKSLALGDWDKVKKEEINATRVIKQLKNLMLEMDILRGNVNEADLDKFDEMTVVGRNKVREAIQEYLNLEIKKANVPGPSSSNQYQYGDEQQDENQMGLHNLPQIQSEFTSPEHQLASRKACLAEFENLQREITDIHDLFFKLNGSVATQAEDINVVEENVEETKHSVEQAEKNLRQALTYKKAMYPLCGAILGFCVAGPVGMVTFGLKAGSVAAVGCGILGATGGVALKNKPESFPTQLMIKDSPEAQTESQEDTQPKTE